MKIYYIFPELTFSGPTNQLYYLIKTILKDKKNYDINLILMRKGSNYNKDKVRFEQLGIKIYEINRTLIGFLEARRIVNSSNDLVIHSTLFPADFLSIFFLRKNKKIITFRTDPFDNIFSRGVWVGGLIFIFHILLSHLSTISVGCSNAIQKRIIYRFGKCDYSILNSIDLGIDFSLNQLGNLHISSDWLTLVSIGSLTERKNPLFICNLIKSVVNKYNLKIELIFYGEGPLLDKIKDFSYLNSEANFLISTPGFKLNLYDSELNFNAHISASSAEGLPNSVLETLVRGIPNFLTDIDEHLEFLEYEKDIIEVYSISDDINEISSNFYTFLNKVKYLDLNKSAVNCRKCFSPHITSEKYINLYSKIGGNLV